MVVWTWPISRKRLKNTRIIWLRSWSGLTEISTVSLSDLLSQITYPSTFGVFEDGVVDVGPLHLLNSSLISVLRRRVRSSMTTVARSIWTASCSKRAPLYLSYIDAGANLNAQIGLTNPATCGGDVCHMNLHKTFAMCVYISAILALC